MGQKDVCIVGQSAKCRKVGCMLSMGQSERRLSNVCTEDKRKDASGSTQTVVQGESG